MGRLLGPFRILEGPESSQFFRRGLARARRTICASCSMRVLRRPAHLQQNLLTERMALGAGVYHNLGVAQLLQGES